MIISIAGLVIGIGAILLGNFLEGGHFAALIQPTAALIVGGGTLGATLLSSTMDEFKAALGAMKKVFLGKDPDFTNLVKEISNAAAAARKDGILALEKSLGAIENPFFKKYLRYVIDGYDPATLKDMMEEAIHHEEEFKLAVAKVWETGGGFSPTVGIIGAVLGLIHVMSNLSDSSKLGAGIAVAFVATVYGVGAANLVMLPIANKIKKISAAEMLELHLIYTGLVSIQSGLNPRVIEEKLNNLVGGHGEEGGEGAARQAA